ncbi:phosphonate C-P lyase system protein PhnH [Polaromonas sp. SM01]|uniref:phosphonate C-P lyase system protein PhnH n=1 Tax=Polaromonas sp. SM01 TaxID=3085630 RepID=UPI002980AD9D|nr:phosphonate C-P lyase system protein PhnH [Polaromonas sp. SM01]MDW5442410.1 phosphonate C-P lyase system protein PhnH [Polaromonas sp. SM01]
MTQQHSLSAGFVDPVHDAQQAFRRVLDALSRPGQPVALGQTVKGLALGPAMAHLLLALTDDDTAVWWPQGDCAEAQWLRFHTGASRAAAPSEAAFAVLSHAAGWPALDTFAAGTMDAPETAATLLVEVASLETGPAVEWRGPGIQDMQTVRIAGLPEDFWAQWQANHASFPQGVDIVFTCADAALGLPRTTRVRRLEGVLGCSS